MLFSLSGCKSKARFDSYGLRSIEIRMDPEDAGSLTAAATAHIDFPASVLIDGDEHRAMISAAGATSARSSRKSFNIKLKDGDYRGAKKFRISAAVEDQSMIRSLLALEVFSAAGVATSWAEPAFVHLNDRILGLYTAIERIDDDFFTNRGIDWERLYTAEGDADFGPTFEGRIDIAFTGKPEPANLSAMIALRRTLSIADENAFIDAVFRILDRENVVNYMAGAQIANHFDGFNKNLFYYQLTGSHLIRLAPWDFDLDWKDRSEIESWYLNHLFVRIGRIAPLRAEIQGRITTLLAGNASEAILRARISEWKAQMSEAYSHDPWLGRSGKSLDVEAEKLAQAVSERISRIR